MIYVKIFKNDRVPSEPWELALQSEKNPDSILDPPHHVRIVHTPNPTPEPTFRRRPKLLAHDERTPVEVRLLRGNLQMGENVRSLCCRERN